MTRPLRLTGLFLLLATFTACGVEEETRGHPGIELDAFRGEPSNALTVCASGVTLNGIDVSHYNGTVNWAAVKGANRSFAFAKATEGLTYSDPQFATNWAAMKQAGIVRGAYHFFRRNDDGKAQADWLLSHVTLEPGDLPPVLDWEWESTADPGAATSVARAQAFVDEIRAQTGVSPIVYSSASFLATVGSPTQFNTLPLWDAIYSGSCPTIPNAWATWTFWQYSSTGTLLGDGGVGGVDVNLFNGTLAQLQALTIPAAVADGGVDAGAQDAGELDAGLHDAGTVDAGEVDAGTLDGGAIDGGTHDGGAVDAGEADAGSHDAGIVDAGETDAGTSDAGAVDGGVHDGGHADAGHPDAGLWTVSDGGFEPPAPLSGGCGTAPTESGAASPLWLLFAFLALLRLRARLPSDA